MDPALAVTRWLAGPVAKFLDADGKTPEERRAEVIEEAGLAGEEIEDVALRHIARGAAWSILFGMVFAAGVLVLVPVSAFAGERTKDLVFDIVGWVIFFPFWMAAVHGVRMLVSCYLPERWWDPGNRLWRVALLAQTPEYILGVLATAAGARWW
ncbi:hypothetical protein [Micromonospora sp. NPDC005197]|uniref:hypothetical protein n=1 Tax=unclassified Micromonospora TaxID=2617518 RepID=UPI0033B859F8